MDNIPAPVRSPLILALDSAEATLESVGGKGASLAHLAAAGLPVPPGFHITTHGYRHFVTANDIQNAILEAAALAHADQLATLEDASARIQALFTAGQMPAEMATEILRAYADLSRKGSDGNGEPVAVRSSATAEDLPGMSFAGQQATYLNVQGEDALLAAIIRCWASLWTARAIGYRIHYGIRPDDVSLAVVVQHLIPADAAGILFTANPMNGRRDQMVINAAWGLGEAIVGGLVTPDTLFIDKQTAAIASQQIADKTVMTVRSAGGTEERPVPDALRRRPVLSAAQVSELVRIGTRIEELYGQPMDIEWAVQEEQVFVLQARPITALPTPSPASELDWSLPRPGGRYARASVIELLPDPLTPLFATLGMPHWNDALADLGQALGVTNLLGNYKLTTINDYAYYDIGISTAQAAQYLISLPRMIVRILPLLRRARERWAVEARPAYWEVVSKWQEQDFGGVPAARLLEGAKAIVRAAAQHYLAIQSGILPAAYMSETLFRSVYDRLVRRPGDPPALTFLLGYDSTPIRAEESLYDLAIWARGQAELYAYLTHTPATELARANHEHTGPIDHAVDAWPEFRQRLANHLARFGHTIYDLDFAKPTPAEEPAPLLGTLKFFLSNEAKDPYERRRAATSARNQATQASLARLHRPWLGLFQRTLRLAQEFAPLREDALADVGLGWPVLRQMLHEVGQRLVQAGVLDEADSVFWLKADELQSLAQGLDAGQTLTDYRKPVSERRATWTRERQGVPPLALPAKEGMKFMGFDWSRFAPARTNQAQGDTIRGTGTSPGRMTGTARVIHGPEEFGQMQHGDILVARITTPAWTPLFVLAGAVVTDIGGPLSHGSIVAREYHIPAVLGTGVATERIESGQRVTVDGDAGTVTLTGNGMGGLSAPQIEPDTSSEGQHDRRRIPRLGLAAIVILAMVWLWRKRRGANPRRRRGISRTWIH